MQNRKSTQNLLVKEILNIISSEPFTPIPEDFFSHSNSLENEDINSKQLSAEIYNHIILLRVMIDFQHNIQSKLVTLSNGTTVYIRCAELGVMSRLQEKKIAVYNYLRIFYAYLLAAIVFSKINEFDTSDFAKEIMHIKKITTDAFSQHLAVADDESMFRCLDEAKGDLIKLIQIFYGRLSRATINDRIDQAKDWVALDEPSVPVCTVIKTNEEYFKKTIIILDEPCSQLTPEQSNLFAHLSSRDWFMELTSFQQDLVKYYKNKILTGSSVIPSRLRGIIPLNKNAFKETIYVETSPDELQVINTYYHTGTVAHVSHKDETIATNISRLNMRQQKLACHADAMVMICLNSQHADKIIGFYEWMNGREFIADDSEIIKLTEAAALQLADENIYYSKICLNGFSKIEYNNYSGIYEITTIVTNNLSRFNPELPQISELKMLMVRLKEKISSWNYNVIGLDIIHLLTQVASANNLLAEQFPEKGLKNVAVWFGCASGENRTGITFYHVIAVSIKEYFKTYKCLQQVLDMVANTQHIHVMTGFQGNTFGKEGIRSKSRGSFKYDHPGSLLITQTSDIKSIPACDATFDGMMNRLQEAISLIEMNETFKHLILLAKQCLKHAENQRTCIVFLPDQVKNIYTEIMYTLACMLTAPFNSNSLSIFSNIQESLSSILIKHDESLNEKLIVLDSLLAKIICETNNLIKLMPSEQLAKHGLFKSDEHTVSTIDTSESRRPDGQLAGRPYKSFTYF